ncbi:MAG TPA: aminotransferase class I/II-fold pyridoxal phosphate-dependent enzyme, partial [Dyella sp.]
MAFQTAERAQAQLQRRLRCVERVEGPYIQSNGRRLLAFCTNDYLGLAHDPRLVAALKKAADASGVGSGSAHLICGHRREHAELEEALAAWTGRERALLFSTGYMANLGAVTALVGRGDALFQDRLNHASLLDAGLLSGARFRRFAHGDAAALAGQLARSDAQRKLVVTDGVFSMDGDQAPLPGY